MNDIQVGDLVMVVQPQKCCNKWGTLGLIGRAVAMDDGGLSVCSSCGTINESRSLVLMSDGVARRIERLKRIPPLSELESIDHKEEQPA